jgi:hypothetical protein
MKPSSYPVAMACYKDNCREVLREYLQCLSKSIDYMYSIKGKRLRVTEVPVYPFIHPRITLYEHDLPPL